IPDRTFISVDLPAPFSPQIAWISPRLTFRLTSASALTPGNSLVIPFMERITLSICPHPRARDEKETASAVKYVALNYVALKSIAVTCVALGRSARGDERLGVWPNLQHQATPASVFVVLC